jgi:hypothetical protein
MHTNIPQAIQPLLQEYLRLLDTRLPGLLDGFYIHGSIALGAFNPQSSDIDFVAVVSRRCLPDDVEQLRAIHQEIEQRYTRWPLQGTYLQWADLGHLEDTIPPHPYYHDGVLYASGRHEVNEVTWCLLKKHGIALKGPEPRNLDFDASEEALLGYMRENINRYWASFTRVRGQMAALLTDWGIQWAVLGVLRQMYTLRECDITSKTGAGEYALTWMAARWHKLIQEAINIRENPHIPSLYKSKIVRAVDAVRFLKYVIGWANALPTV